MSISDDTVLNIKFKLVNLDSEFNYMVFIVINSQEDNVMFFRHIVSPFGKKIMLKEGDNYISNGNLKFNSNSLKTGDVYLNITLAKVLRVNVEGEKYNAFIQDTKQLKFRIEKI